MSWSWRKSSPCLNMATYSWPLNVENVRQAGINWDLNNVALPNASHRDRSKTVNHIKYWSNFTFPLRCLWSKAQGPAGTAVVQTLKMSLLWKSPDRLIESVVVPFSYRLDKYKSFFKNGNWANGAAQQQQHSNTFSGCRSLWPRLSLGTRVGQGTAAVDSIWPGDGATLFHLLPRPKPQQKVASCWTFFFIILHCRVFFLPVRIFSWPPNTFHGLGRHASRSVPDPRIRSLDT